MGVGLGTHKKPYHLIFERPFISQPLTTSHLCTNQWLISAWSIGHWGQPGHLGQDGGHLSRPWWPCLDLLIVDNNYILFGSINRYNNIVFCFCKWQFVHTKTCFWSLFNMDANILCKHSYKIYKIILNI